MKVRSSRISASISSAIFRDHPASDNFTSHLLERLISLFSFFHLPLVRFCPVDFLNLRRDVWHLNEEDYLASFSPSTTSSSTSRGHRTAKTKASQLVTIGDLGYSGSTFFTTADRKFLIKSLPRRFEYEFYTHELHEEYVAHMKKHHHSLLIRITDIVFAPHPTLGGMLGATPTHHIIMENLLYDEPDATDGESENWTTYDLKPDNYFFPERDIADGRLAPSKIKNKLVDAFPDKQVRVPLHMKEALITLLNADTQLLARKSAVDYSLFLVRFPNPRAQDTAIQQKRAPSHILSSSHPWMTGVPDMEGEWAYRAVILDFFWAKSKFRAQVMTGLVDTYNVMADQGPMSITAEPGEYRERFMKMADTLVVGAVNIER